MVVIGGANSAGQAAVYFSGYAARVSMLVRADSLSKSMSHYLVEQIAALENVEVRTSTQAVAAEGENGQLEALRIRDGTGAETREDVDACFVFVGAAPRTDWLAGVVARDERGFILAGADVRKRGRARLAPAPGTLCAGDERAGCIRGRGRAGEVDQAGGERGRGGVDGGLVDPRIPGQRVSHPTIDQLRAVDLFEGLSDAELERWAQAAVLRRVSPGESVAEQGQHSAAFHLVLEGSLEAIVVDAHGRAEPVGEHVAPTWVGATAVLTDGLSAVTLQAATEATVAIVSPRTSSSSSSRSGRCSSGRWQPCARWSGG